MIKQERKNNWSLKVSGVGDRE